MAIKMRTFDNKLERELVQVGKDDHEQRKSGFTKFPLPKAKFIRNK